MGTRFSLTRRVDVPPSSTLNLSPLRAAGTNTVLRNWSCKAKMDRRAEQQSLESGFFFFLTDSTTEVIKPVSHRQNSVALEKACHQRQQRRLQKKKKKRLFIFTAAVTEFMRKKKAHHLLWFDPKQFKVVFCNARY